MAQAGVRFDAGEVVLLRHFQRSVVSAIFTMCAVRHDDQGLLLWGAEGSRHWILDMPDGRRLRDTPLDEWVGTVKVRGKRISKHSMLSWHPTGAAYSIRFFFREGRFANWYANLEEPAVAWRGEQVSGADTVDWDLDVWIDPDRSWRWKDEAEFVERLQWPQHYWVEDENAVREAGREVIALAEAAAFPFDGTWCDFRPDATWLPLVMDLPPEAWDRPRALLTR
jgi:hypothetical protein